MSYTSWTNNENPDKWPEPPKGYYYMPAEDDIITLRTVLEEGTKLKFLVVNVPS